MIGERLDARDRPAEFYAAVGEGTFPPWLIHADPAPTSGTTWNSGKNARTLFHLGLPDPSAPGRTEADESHPYICRVKSCG